MDPVQHIKTRIDTELSRLTGQLAERNPKELYESIRYIVSLGGKRLRPLLCILSYNLFADDYEREALYPALGLEVFHTFTLAHDDIMDKAEQRRGKECLHKKYGTDLAILAGDAMSIYAYELLSHSPERALPQVLRMFSRSAMEICEGQQMDMAFETLPSASLDDYLRMISLKTAVLLACSTYIGATCAGASGKNRERMYDFGYNLGMGFQLWDDYLDSFGDPTVFGKKIGGDILNNKKTWLLIEAFERCDDKERKELERLMAIDDDPEKKIAGIIGLYEGLGLREQALRKIENYYNTALDLLDQVEADRESKSLIRDYCTSMIERQL